MTVAPERETVERPMAGCPRRRAPRPASAGGSPEGDTPRLADGVQLLGEYASSGYQDPQYLARRPGGQLVQLSELLHHVAGSCDGTRGLEEIAARVSESYGRAVSADNVRTLVEDKLRPLGVLAAADGSSPPVATSDPLLGLKLRAQLLRPDAVCRLAALVRPAFWPPVVAAVVAGLVAVDVWLFFVHGVGGGLRATVQQPAVLLLVAAVVVVSAALHELGHAAACAYGGARPGGMGAGIYVVWPAFYTDVTDAYRLDRRGRLRTDLGGIYVNAAVVITAALLYAVTGFEPLVLLAFLLQIQVLQQLLPFLRLDGYYVVSDLVGVPDLFRRIGPVLRSSLPFRPQERQVAELKPWVRRVVAGWVFVLVPVLGLNLGYFVLSAPRIAATGWDSAAGFVGTITSAGGLEAAWAAVQLLLLLLPTVGITVTVTRMTRRATAGAWRWSAGSGGRRVGVVLGASAVAGLLVLAWYPDARLSPYREGERGTVQQHVRELSAFRSGSPLLRSPAQAREPLPPVEPGTSAVLGAAPPPSPRPTPSPSAKAPGGVSPTESPSVSGTATGPAAEAEDEVPGGRSGAAGGGASQRDSSAEESPRVDEPRGTSASGDGEPDGTGSDMPDTTTTPRPSSTSGATPSSPSDAGTTPGATPTLTSAPTAGG